MITHLSEETLNNENFRKVLTTNEHSQVVIMSLKPGEEIGLETHSLDQFLYIVHGEGEAVVGNETQNVHSGSAVVVPAGEEHNVTNTSDSETMKLFTVYSPAEHEDGTVHETKAEADAAEEHHHE